MRPGSLGSWAIFAVLALAGASAAGNMPVPEVRDDAVDHDVRIGVPPLGPGIASPWTDLISADLAEGGSGFEVVVRMQTWQRDPSGGRLVSVGGSLGERRIVFEHVEIGPSSVSRGDACVGFDCVSFPVRGHWDRMQNELHLVAPWETFLPVPAGAVLSRTHAQSAGAVGSGGSGTTWGERDVAPNPTYSFEADRGWKAHDTFGDDFVFVASHGR